MLRLNSRLWLSRSETRQMRPPTSFPSPKVSKASLIDADITADDRWVLFNDFVVREVSEEEVFQFPDAWKVSIPVERSPDDFRLPPLSFSRGSIMLKSFNWTNCPASSNPIFYTKTYQWRGTDAITSSSTRS